MRLAKRVGSMRSPPIAAKGPGEMVFSDEDMATMVEAYGSPGDALYAIQLEAQRRMTYTK
jgi:hypothetical protein